MAQVRSGKGPRSCDGNFEMYVVDTHEEVFDKILIGELRGQMMKVALFLTKQNI